MAEKKESSTTDFLIRSGGTTELVYEIPSLHIRLPIDPAKAESLDDKFTLSSSDGSYEKILTVKDDMTPGDEFVDLIYDNLKPKLNYSLEVNPGKEGSPYKLFEDVPYNDIIDYYTLLEEGDELEEDDEEEDDSDSGDDPDWDDEEDGGSEYGGDCDDDEVDPESIKNKGASDDEDDKSNWNAEADDEAFDVDSENDDDF